jgi:type II restriction/modification system DNA methylase subunit YeeA
MSPEKIFIRRIVNRQDKIMASYGNIGGVVKKDLYVFVLKQNAPIDYFYLLGILNSELISYIYIGKSAIALKDDFRQATLEELRELPITIPKKNIINALTRLSKLRFELNDKLNENDKIFLENIIDSLVYGIYFQDLILKEELNEICNEINDLVKKYGEKSTDRLKYSQNIIKLLNTTNTDDLVRKIQNKD